MQVSFREYTPFDIWIWVEFQSVPSDMEQRLVEEVFNSWFYLGKLGAFNAENLQVHEAGFDISYLDYDQEMVERSMMAPMHNMGDFEYESNWGRCWFDLGTSDEIAFDILINALQQLSQEYVTLKQLVIGGENEDWPIDPQKRQLSFMDQDEW